eukprot:m.88402 g.88402  ORF g.88402 m.88402 type:complete len:137 (+) comp15183_c1_seq2:670-1080(+)
MEISNPEKFAAVARVWQTAEDGALAMAVDAEEWNGKKTWNRSNSARSRVDVPLALGMNREQLVALQKAHDEKRAMEESDRQLSLELQKEEERKHQERVKRHEAAKAAKAAKKLEEKQLKEKEKATGPMLAPTPTRA